MKKLYRSREADAEPNVSLARAALHLGALSSFAIAWQYFQPLGGSAELFVKHWLEGFDIVLFALILVLLPPMVLVAIEAVAGLIWGPARDAAHLLFVAGFAALIAWQLLDEVDQAIPGPVIYPLALFAGVAAGVAYWKLEPVRSGVTVLSVGPVLVSAIFLFFTPVSGLVFTDDGPGPVRSVTADAPVVMIVLDEFPVASLMDADGRIDAARYPNFAELAGDATWYRNATSVADHTQFAVPAILTGKASDPDKLPIASEHPDNLFRLLGGRYRLNVLEWITDLCTPAVCSQQVGRSLSERLRSFWADLELAKVPVAPPGVTYRLTGWVRPDYDPLERQREAGGEGSVRRDAFAEEDVRVAAFLDTLRHGRGRTFDFLHLLLPHFPWARLPTGQVYRTRQSAFFRPPYRWSENPRFSEIAYQRHLLQLEYTDGALGEVMGRLRENGAYEGSLIVVTADHGVSFKAGEQARDFTEGNLSDIASVPLIVKAPDQLEGRISDGYVKVTDILPTIAAELGIDLPWETDGLPADQVGRTRSRVVVHRQIGRETLTADPAELERERDATVAHKVRLFGSGSGPGLFALGGHGELIGEAVEGLEVAPRGEARATIDAPERLQSVDPLAPTLPAEITGYVRGGEPSDGRRIAVALNGEIVATAWTLGTRQGEFFSVIAPEPAFRGGANPVELFEISESGRLTRL